jgi:hypothetical protein
MHQHDIYGNPVQPGGESGVAAERGEFAMQLKKGFLREVFGQREIMHHAQANGEDAFLVLQVKLRECVVVAGLGPRQNIVADRFRQTRETRARRSQSAS